MHGSVDSISIPIHLPSTSSAGAGSGTTAAGSKGKGKGKEKEVQPASSSPYDVVANWTSREKDDVQRKVAMAIELGYSTVILTLSIPAHFNPSNLRFPTPLFPNFDPRTADTATKKTGLILQRWSIRVINYDEEAVKGAAVKGIYGFTNSTAPLYPASTSILSVAPTALFAFSHCCLSLSPASPFAPSIISFDPSLSSRLAFPMKRGPVHTAHRAGLQFEIVYRGLTQMDDSTTSTTSSYGSSASSSSVRRRNWIAGAKEIVRATGGIGVVLSSGAVDAAEMRSMHDMINICHLIGLTPAQAKDALTVNPQRAIARGLSMRQSYRGVFSNPTLLTTSRAALASNPTLASLDTSSPAKKRTAAASEADIVSKGKKLKRNNEEPLLV